MGPGSAAEEGRVRGEGQTVICEGCNPRVGYFVCQMTAGTTPDKRVRKTKNTNHRTRAPKRRKKPSKSDSLAANEASADVVVTKSAGSGTIIPPSQARQTRNDTNKRQRHVPRSPLGVTKFRGVCHEIQSATTNTYVVHDGSSNIKPACGQVKRRVPAC